MLGSGMKAWLCSSVTILLCLAACNKREPVEKPPQVGDEPKTLPSDQPVPPDVELHPELVAFPSGSLLLHGWLWRPPGAGPFPTVVYNHGSESLPGWMPDEAKFFVRQHRFVLFVPHRRGQGRSADAGASVQEVFEASGRDASAMTDALVTQTDDVMSAIAYAASLPFVDAKRIAVAGCSLGGIESLFAAERGSGIVAAIDFSGGAMTWAASPSLQDRMKVAARNAKVPVFFLQAENDYDTSPSLVLSDEMKRAGKPVRVHVFPPNGTTHDEGHHFCIGSASPPWGDEVMEFLRGPMGLRER